jgi:fluoride exporter
MIRMILFVAAGGAAGAVARFGMSGLVQPSGSSFPWGTLAVNVVGSFALGFLMRFLLGTGLANPELRGGLTIGFCGSFTTMSTFGYETVTLLQTGSYWRAAAYGTASLSGCLVAIVAGMFAASRVL